MTGRGPADRPPDLSLLAASVVFAGASALGSIVAARQDLPGKPFGVAIPLSVRSGLLIGWGAGVAAPWPMPVAALIAALAAGRAERSALPGAVCAGIGVGCLAGTLMEPVTYLPRSWTPAVRTAIAVNVAASAALAAAGLRRAATARTARECQ